VDDWIDTGACANLMRAGASGSESSSSDLTRCLVDLVKQSSSDLADPEEVLLGAARQAQAQMREVDHLGARVGIAAAASAGVDIASVRGGGDEDEMLGGAGHSRPGFSTRQAPAEAEADLGPLDASTAAKRRRGATPGARGGRGAAMEARGAAEWGIAGGGGGGRGGRGSDGLGGDSGMGTEAGTIQDSFVFYVSVAGLSAFFTRTICSYIVSWW
jgi:hypothetical protein